MASYSVDVKKSAARQLRKLDPDIVKRIAARVDQLQRNPFPHGVECVKGQVKPPLYRIRIGDYRIVYTVDHSAQTVTISAIGHRSEIYRRRL